MAGSSFVKRIINTTSSLRTMIGDTFKRFSGRRDYYDNFGYLHELVFEDYMEAYLRGDIAHRIVNCFPEATWSKKPQINDKGEIEKRSVFERAFDDLAQKINLYHYLIRADKLANLGQYSLLFLGVRDGKNVEKPIGKIAGPEDILYLMPLAENQARIKAYEQNPSSQRYGLPKIYEVSIGGYGDQNRALMEEKVVDVHASRCIHIAEGRLNNDVFGIPRLKSVMNRLDDLNKVVGGSSEVIYLNGRGALNINAPMELDVKDVPKLKQEIENFFHNYKTRALKTRGMDVKILDMAVHSPEAHVKVILDLILASTGIPKRVLMGSERGELSSSQDEKAWWTRVIERCNKFCEPIILRPVIDKFIEIGALPYVEKYDVVWSDFITTSEKEKADIAMRKSQSISTYSSVEDSKFIIPPKQFVEEVLGMTYREEDLEDFKEEFKDDLDEILEIKAKSMQMQDKRPLGTEPKPKDVLTGDKKGEKSRGG